VTETRLRVAMICTGNICRSPMAEVVLRHFVDAESSLRGSIHVTSAGTANWHVGSPMDDRARRALDRAGFDGAGSLAAFADRAYLDDQDIVVGMTREHVHEVRKRLTNDTTEVILLRNVIEPGRDLDLFDPYYGDDVEFDECLDVLRRGGRRLTSEFRRRLDGDSSGA
jgi:low molecular weight protein-tyrosine phosphatase